MKIRPVGAVLINVDRHDEANRRFFATYANARYKLILQKDLGSDVLD
jgi:hypothetical protein